MTVVKKKESFFLFHYPQWHKTVKANSSSSLMSRSERISMANSSKRQLSLRVLLRQDPLEAILVIFGRRALIFFCLKALGKNEK